MALLGSILSNQSVLAGADLLLASRYADAGNTGTAETDLYSETIAGTVFASNGDAVFAEYALTLVNSTSSKQVRAYFAGTLIFDSGALSISASATMGVYITIIRESATAVRYVVSANTSGASTATYAMQGRITGLDLTSASTLKITGTAAGVGAATNDIVATMEVVSRGSAAALTGNVVQIAMFSDLGLGG